MAMELHQKDLLEQEKPKPQKSSQKVLGKCASFLIALVHLIMILCWSSSKDFQAVEVGAASMNSIE